MRGRGELADNWSAGFRQFVVHWGVASSDRSLPYAARLRSFRVGFRDSSRRAGGDRPNTSPAGARDLIPVFAKIAAALGDRRTSSTLVNPWSIAGLKRVEVRNASVLASLWAPATGGATAVAFLDSFLRRVTPVSNLPTTEQLARPYVVRTEHCAAGTTSERVDITIEGVDFVLGIEVKIDAKEGPDQLERYARAVASWGRARNVESAVVLLAPFRPSIPGISHARWEDVIFAARSVLPRKRGDYGLTHHLIRSFADHAAHFRKRAGK